MDFMRNFQLRKNNNNFRNKIRNINLINTFINNNVYKNNLFWNIFSNKSKHNFQITNKQTLSLLRSIFKHLDTQIASFELEYCVCILVVYSSETLVCYASIASASFYFASIYQSLNADLIHIYMHICRYNNINV